MLAPKLHTEKSPSNSLLKSSVEVPIDPVILNDGNFIFLAIRRLNQQALLNADLVYQN